MNRIALTLAAATPFLGLATGCAEPLEQAQEHPLGLLCGVDMECPPPLPAAVDESEPPGASAVLARGWEAYSMTGPVTPADKMSLVLSDKSDAILAHSAAGVGFESYKGTYERVGARRAYVWLQEDSGRDAIDLECALVDDNWLECEGRVYGDNGDDALWVLFRAES